MQRNSWGNERSCELLDGGCCRASKTAKQRTEQKNKGAGKKKNTTDQKKRRNEKSGKNEFGEINNGGKLENLGDHAAQQQRININPPFLWITTHSWLVSGRTCTPPTPQLPDTPSVMDRQLPPRLPLCDVCFGSETMPQHSCLK